RPGALPRRSTESSPAGERTTRTSSRLARAVRQATQVRCGRLRTGRDAGLTALGSLLFASEERAVLFIQVLLIRLRGFGFDLSYEIVADLRFLFSGHRLGPRHSLRVGLRPSPRPGPRPLSRPPPRPPPAPRPRSECRSPSL